MTHRRTPPALGAIQHHARAITIERDATGSNSRRVRFVASDESVDRYGDIIRANGWQLDNFRKNPVLLFAHQSRAMPVGKVEPIAVEGSKLIAHAEFMPEGMNDFADDVWKAVDAGFLNASSVGFMPLAPPNPIFDADGQWTGFEYVAQELLELSVVPVPANPNALQLARDLKIADAHVPFLFAFQRDHLEADDANARLHAVQRAAASRSRVITLSQLGR